MGEHQQFLCFLFAETHKLPPARKHTWLWWQNQKEKVVGRDSYHVSKWVIRRSLWVQCVPKLLIRSHCIQLCPLYTPLQKLQLTSTPPHTWNMRDQTTWPWVWWCLEVESSRKRWFKNHSSSPVVDFGSVIAGDVALISCGWRTNFPPLSLTVTHIITSDSLTDEAHV